MSDEIKTEKARNVLLDLFNGGTIKKGLIKHEIDCFTFYDTLDQSTQLLALYARAEKYNADMLADELIGIADTEENAVKARNMIDVRKWLASKRQPKKYGDRIEHHHEGQIDLIAAIAESKERALLPISYSSNNASVQDAEYKEISSNDDTGQTPEQKAIADLFE